jgi:hypothetical protein
MLWKLSRTIKPLNVRVREKKMKRKTWTVTLEQKIIFQNKVVSSCKSKLKVKIGAWKRKKKMNTEQNDSVAEQEMHSLTWREQMEVKYTIDEFKISVIDRSCGIIFIISNFLTT